MTSRVSPKEISNKGDQHCLRVNLATGDPASLLNRCRSAADSRTIFWLEATRQARWAVQFSRPSPVFLFHMPPTIHQFTTQGSFNAYPQGPGQAAPHELLEVPDCFSAHPSRHGLESMA